MWTPFKTLALFSAYPEDRAGTNLDCTAIAGKVRDSRDSRSLRGVDLGMLHQA